MKEYKLLLLVSSIFNNVGNEVMPVMLSFFPILVGPSKLAKETKNPVEKEEVKQGSSSSMQNREEEMGGKSSCSRGHRYEMM